jgi:hypothetical protein
MAVAVDQAWQHGLARNIDDLCTCGDCDVAPTTDGLEPAVLDDDDGTLESTILAQSIARPLGTSVSKHVNGAPAPPRLSIGLQRLLEAARNLSASVWLYKQEGQVLPALPFGLDCEFLARKRHY